MKEAGCRRQDAGKTQDENEGLEFFLLPAFCFLSNEGGTL